MPDLPKPTSGADMPEVAEPWGVMDKHGEIDRFGDRDLAVAKAKEWDTKYSSVAPHRVVRLAVVEVVEPPDSWERLAKDVLDRVGMTPKDSCLSSDEWSRFTARRAALLARGSA